MTMKDNVVLILAHNMQNELDYICKVLSKYYKVYLVIGDNNTIHGNEYSELIPSKIKPLYYHISTVDIIKESLLYIKSKHTNLGHILNISGSFFPLKPEYLFQDLDINYTYITKLIRISEDLYKCSWYGYISGNHIDNIVNTNPLKYQELAKTYDYLGSPDEYLIGNSNISIKENSDLYEFFDDYYGKGIFVGLESYEKIVRNDVKMFRKFSFDSENTKLLLKKLGVNIDSL